MSPLSKTIVSRQRFAHKKQNTYSIKISVLLWRPKQEIPLIGEMSRRDKGVWAKPYLEPVTPRSETLSRCFAWSARIALCFFLLKYSAFAAAGSAEHLSQLTAAARGFSQPLCHGARFRYIKQRTHPLGWILCLAPQTGNSPDRGNVPKGQRGMGEAVPRTCDTSVRNIVGSLAWGASRSSLFLPAGRAAASAPGGAARPAS